MHVVVVEVMVVDNEDSFANEIDQVELNNVAMVLKIDKHQSLDCESKYPKIKKRKSSIDVTFSSKYPRECSVLL
jgi:hypothetical protein